MEQWKTIKTHPNYEVSDLGRVRNITTNELKHSTPNKTGYINITLFKEGKGKTFAVHRLVALYFIPNTNPTQNTIVNHLNCVRSDNAATNLEWCSYSDNMKHMVKVGNNPDFNGHKNPRSKLNPEQVLAIREDSRLHRIIAKDYDVSTNVITNIKNGSTYKNIQGTTKDVKVFGSTQFTEEDILSIRNDNRPDKDIAKSYFCDVSNISRIKTGKTYKRVGGPIRSIDYEVVRPSGEKIHSSTITEDIAKKIKYQYVGKAPAYIYKELGISKHVVYSILSGRTWKHI